MINKHITEEELKIFQVLNNPVSCAEVMFHDFDSLGSFSHDKNGHIRTSQLPFLAYDSMARKESNMTDEKFFAIKKGMAEGFALGGRLTGKSCISLIVDCLVSTWNKVYKKAVISSLDFLHLKGVIEPIITVFENHAIFKILKSKILRTPSFRIECRNGCLIESVNNNIAGKNPGGQWEGKHVDRHWAEEASYISKKVTNKQLMSQAETGCISRYSGMTIFSKLSPMGEIFYDLKNKNKIINLPSYSNPTWNKDKDEAAIGEFGGKESLGYKTQIQGKIVESGEQVYDIDRIRETYNNKKTIKAFEINKNNYYRHKDIVILDKLNNAEKCIVALDLGEGGAPTEIIILFLINRKWHYHYNISTHRLAPDEEETIIRYIIQQVEADIIALDMTSGGGKYLFSSLSKDYFNNVIGVSFNEKIKIDFEKDTQGNPKIDHSGKYIYRYAYISDWSIQRLKHIFYNKRIKCLMDYKLDTQFDSIITLQSKMRTAYKSKGADHLHQAFQVFAIADWLTEYKITEPISNRKPGFGIGRSV